jgi:CBS domain-containing protein
MAAKVKDLMSRPAIFIDPEATVAHAATLMRRRNIRSLIIALEGNTFGIITTTDIRDKIVAADRDPRVTPVRDIMSTPLATAQPEWSLKQCSVCMKDQGVHHLPVIDQRGMIVGMISATDIFMAVEESGWGRTS